jgi:pyridoxal biosynthesis lyase PdxS
MSSNNLIVVSNSKFTVTHNDADTGEVIELVGQCKNLEEAINLAQKFQEENIVEYGIHFVK